MTEPRVLLPLIRGDAEGAQCHECPFSKDGLPNKPVFMERSENPEWILVGEGPGVHEVRHERPFIGATGQEVNKLLGKVGRRRETLLVTNATLCLDGSTTIRLGDGTLGRIDRMVAARYDGLVQTVDEAGYLTTRRVVGWFKNRRGAREMRDVSHTAAQTAGAHRIHSVMTEDHPVLTPEGWRIAAEVAGGEIATGDRAPTGNALQIAYGTLLGDGTLHRGALVVRHAQDQIAYAYAKASALSGFGVGTIVQPGRNGWQNQFGFRTRAGAWGHATRELFYNGRQKRIPRSVLEAADDLLFAIWYLDDGCMHQRGASRGNRRPRAEICGAAFLEDDLQLAGAVMRDRGLDNVVRGGRIHFSADSTEIFSRRIARFVPPALDYKLRPEDRGRFDANTYAPTSAAPFFARATSVMVEPRRENEDAAVYCLEVEDTHNFITSTAVVHNCIPFAKATDVDKQRAAKACHGRLVQELAQFPGLPVLTLGGVAARSLIPSTILDQIDPPDTEKINKQQKLRQQPLVKAERSRRKAIEKRTQKEVAKLIKLRRKQITVELKVKYRRRPDEAYLERTIRGERGKLELKARENAIRHVDAKIKERALKKAIKDAQPKKKKKAGKIKITDIVGTLFECDVDGSGVRPLIPGIHPAALLRSSGASIGGSHTPDMAWINLKYDFLKIDQLARGRDIRLKLNIEIETQDPKRVVELFRKFYDSALREGAFSLDLETYVDDPNRHHALMAYVARISVIGLATDELAISVPWALLPGWALSSLQLLLAKCESTYQNGLYDRTVLRSHGFTMGPRWFDTLLAHHAAFPGNSHRLQTVAAQFFGVEPWKSEYRNNDEDTTKLAIYNAKDTGATHKLRGPLKHWIKKTKTESVAEIDRAMSDVASQMHLAGMPIDYDTNKELLDTFSKNVREARAVVEDMARDPKLREQIWHYLAISQARVQRKADPKDFEERYQIRLSAMQLDPDWKWKIGAGKHIAALLQAMSVPLTQITDSGEISTKKDVLESLTNEPIVRDILNYRENEKLLSTFVFSMFDRYDQAGNIICYGFADADHFIHPIWTTHKISGRWASRWPVVSNVPKDKWKKLTPEEIVALGTGTVAELYKLGAGKPMLLIDGRIIRLGKDKSIARMTRPNLRRQIRAKPGFKIVGFDYAQIEAKGIALVSGDPFLMSCFEWDPSIKDTKKDVHIECAQIIFCGTGKARWDEGLGRPMKSKDLDDLQKQIREQTKPLEYGSFYGAQIETLWKQLLKEGFNFRKEDVALAVAKLKQAMPGVVQWQKDAVAKALTPPHDVCDIIEGRRRVWPTGNVEPPEAMNISIQTLGASIMNRGMRNCYRDVMPRFPIATGFAQVHDAAYFHVPEDEAADFAAALPEAFEQTYENQGRSIFFNIETKISDTWAGA